MFIFLLIVEFSFCHDDCLFICIPVESSVFNGRISSTSMPEVGLVKVVWTFDFFCKKKKCQRKFQIFKGGLLLGFLLMFLHMLAASVNSLMLTVAESSWTILMKSHREKHSKTNI